MENLFFNVPGLGNSDEGHWQTIWENQFANFARINQYHWDFPVCSQWVQSIERTVKKHQHHPIYLVAHSMGCHAVAQWAAHSKLRVEGALLVAPPNVQMLEHTGRVSGFVPEALSSLPFPSIVVASSNDPFARLAQSQKYAEAWGSELIDIGRKGHINASSNLDDWQQGISYLKRLIRLESRKTA